MPSSIRREPETPARAVVVDDGLDSVKYSVYTRAAMALERAARLRAVMHGRDYVLPEDVAEMAYPILRHRIALDYNTDIKDTDAIISEARLEATRASMPNSR